MILEGVPARATSRRAPAILLVAILAAPPPGPALAAGSTQALENASVRLAFDDRAFVTELTNRLVPGARNSIGRPSGFWRLNFRRGASLENIVRPDDQIHRFERTPDGLRVAVDELRHGGQKLPIRLSFTVALSGDEITWRARVENRSDVEVTELFFPELSGVSGLGRPGSADDLVWPAAAGQRYRDLKAHLRPGVDALVQIDEPVNSVANPVLEVTYPFRASMAWFELTNDQEGIYFGSHDPTFMSGALRVSRQFDRGGDLSLGFVKYVFVRPGATWESSPVVVAPHTGAWHTGAEKYRRWAATWRKPRPKPEWVRKMKGLFLVILKQQYGERMWRYDELPLLFQEARANGMDTLGLFGWTEAGHDNGYPEYQPDEAMGGAQALRDGLRAVSAAGGNTVLYCQGHIVDAASDFYRKAGETLALRNLWGTPHFLQYSKADESSFLKNFSQKLFAPMNPGSDAWIALLVERGRDILAHGPRGILYDQIGGMDPAPVLGDPAPSLAFARGRVKQLSTLRERVKAKKPDAGFLVEQASDISSQYVDAIHGVGPGFRLDALGYPAPLRYTFPDIIMTARQPAPRADRKQVNFAFAYGFRFELEVRYRADAETIRSGAKPHLRNYLAGVSALRDRYWDLLGQGTFVHDRGVVGAAPGLTVTAFENGRRRAVVLWNNTAAPVPGAVQVPEHRFVEARTPDGPLAKPPAAIGPQQVAVLVFER